MALSSLSARLLGKKVILDWRKGQLTPLILCDFQQTWSQEPAWVTARPDPRGRRRSRGSRARRRSQPSRTDGSLSRHQSPLRQRGLGPGRPAGRRHRRKLLSRPRGLLWKRVGLWGAHHSGSHQSDHPSKGHSGGGRRDTPVQGPSTLSGAATAVSIQW